MTVIERPPADRLELLIASMAAGSAPVYIFGADIAGKVVQQILLEHNIVISGFLDNNRNKASQPISGTPVFSGQDHLRLIEKSSIVLIASTYIADIIKQLEDNDILRWAPIHQILASRSDAHLKRILNGSLRKNHAGGEFTRDFDLFVLENMKNSQIKYLSKERLYIRSIDVVVTEKCSLKCKDCSNLMQYYESPQNITDEQIFLEIDRVCDLADEINELRIIGGDAMMNKNFGEIANYAASKENVNKVVIYTNGTIAPSVDRLMAISNIDKIFVFVTTYGELSRNAEKLCQTMDQLGIKYNMQPAYGWTDCGRITENRRTEAERKAIFQNCCAKHFTTMTDGKLFRCPFAANLHRLKATSEYEGDYFDLMVNQVDSGDALDARKALAYKFLRDLPTTRYCDHCNGRTYGDPEITPGIQTTRSLPYIRIESV
jgi:hypothetical protein